MADQAVRIWPSLKKRWLFPTQSVEIDDVAQEIEKFTAELKTCKPPKPIQRLLNVDGPVIKRDIKFYQLSNITVIGNSGSFRVNGKLIDARNWVNQARPQRMKLVQLADDQPYFSLVQSGHVFHWTFDSLMPLILWLSDGKTSRKVKLLVKAKTNEYQKKSLEFICRRFALDPPIALHPNEAAQVARLIVAKKVPLHPNALFPQSGFAVLSRMADDLAGKAREATKVGRPPLSGPV